MAAKQNPSGKKRPTHRNSVPTQYVEIVDENNAPLCILGLEDAQRQTLRHRAVLVLLYDEAGKLYLRKRPASSPIFPGRWDIFASSCVQMNEAAEEAALRLLNDELHLYMAGVRFVHETPACPATGFSFVSLFSAGRVSSHAIKNSVPQTQAIMTVDRDELRALATEFRDQLTPALVHLWELNMLFPKKTRQAPKEH
ncbi:NUDIX domain-containing protein [Desulfobaculum bizertense DSM 18034]|uniref:NUDIX domain-containing protein n=2 Tax=Desulfobaculum TaxID=1433996 RepID=A0A1T4W454_9BACT|nr:NUDIX domain-containing protein [Desulfobaculum bizertense DSM 18034]